MVVEAGLVLLQVAIYAVLLVPERGRRCTLQGMHAPARKPLVRAQLTHCLVGAR
jgi:hypothetical protein